MASLGDVATQSERLVFAAKKTDDGAYRLIDFETGDTFGSFPKAELKPNSGVRAMIATALVQFQLSDPDIEKRSGALDSIARDPVPGFLRPCVHR